MKNIKLDRLRLRTTATVVNLVAAVFLVCCANGPFWRAFASALGSATGHWLLLVVAGVILVLVFNCLLSLLSFRPVHKPLLIVVIGIAAIANYYMGSYRIVINGQMITNLLETDFREASEQLSWALFRHVMLLGVLPAGLLMLTQIRYRPWRRELLVRSGVVAVSLALLAVLLLANFKALLLFGRQHSELRMYVNPTYPVYSFFKTLRVNYRAHHKEPLRTIASVVSLEKKHGLVTDLWRWRKRQPRRVSTWRHPHLEHRTKSAAIRPSQVKLHDKNKNRHARPLRREKQMKRDDADDDGREQR